MLDSRKYTRKDYEYNTHMSQIEIEYKFKITSDEQRKLSQKLEKMGKSLKSITHIHKSDIYYRLVREGKADFDVRLRTTTHAHKGNGANATSEYFLTYKIKQSQESATLGEVNKEFETKIENPKILDTMIRVMGAKELIKKEKTGLSYIVSIENQSPYAEKLSVHIELVEVVGLGNFFEIECVADKYDEMSKEKISHIQEILIRFCEQLGLNQTQLEARYYIDLLHEKNLYKYR